MTQTTETMTRRAFEKLLPAGARFHEDRYANNSSWRDQRVLAPKGMTWKDGEHEMVAGCYNGTAVWADETRADLAERVKIGVEPCREPDCEWCPGWDEVAAEYERNR